MIARVSPLQPHAMASPLHPHPLAQLSKDEFARARDFIVKAHSSDDSLFFRSIYLQEPRKAELVPFLEAEHAGKLTDETARPPRLALVEYDILGPAKHQHTRSVVHLGTGEIVSKHTAQEAAYPYYTM